MQNVIRGAALALCLGSVMTAAQAKAIAPETRPVDLVLALDVSTSMNGLIASAKQRLWDVVNELGRAQPRPDLRVAVLSYGSPRYGAHSGYVHVDVPLTRDLDAVNEALFGLSTAGGKEYVARAIVHAHRSLSWSPDPKALRTMFVAGNEAATQDPDFDVFEIAAAAQADGLVVHTVFCGSDGRGPIQSGWRAVATATGGFYASINQNAGAIAEVATPFDDALSALNGKLNTTYLPYGKSGDQRQRNQVRQDANAGLMSSSASASRAVTKGSASYSASEWDLVDAVEDGIELESVHRDLLPEKMRSMSVQERQAFVSEAAAQRARLRAEIARLAKARREYLAENRTSGEERGLSDALVGALKRSAEAKGFRFN